MLNQPVPRLKELGPDIQALDALAWPAGVAVVSFGVSLGVRVNDPAILAAVLERLPPGWQQAHSPEVDELFSLVIGKPGDALQSHELYAGAERVGQARTLDGALDQLESWSRFKVATRAPRHIFYHAGVVAWQGRGVMVPGRSMSGKSTLVAALIQAGAEYYSDEFAVVDENAHVFPFPKLLSLRQGPGQPPRRPSAEALGGTCGMQPVPVGLIVATRYEPGAVWQPHQLSPGEAMLRLLDNAPAAQLRPAEVMRVSRHLAATAVAIESPRGDASELAARLLEGMK